MPGDDLLGFLLGCGCEARCCCGQPAPAPATRPSGLFQQAGRGQEPPRLPDESPFIPSIPSFDSPQRPAYPGHVPSAFGGEFLPSGALPLPGLLTLDSGQIIPLQEHVADHINRQVTELLTPPLRDNSPPDLSVIGVPSRYAAIAAGVDPRLDPINQGTLLAGTQRAIWTRRVTTFSGVVTDTPVTTTAPYLVATGQVRMSGNDVTDYRQQIRWVYLSGDLRRRVERVIAVHPAGNNYLPEAPDYPRYDVLHETAVDRTAQAWADQGETVGPDQPVDPVNGWPIFITLTRGNRLADLLPSPGPLPQDLGPVRWRAESVAVNGPPTTDHALLREGETLTAHGVTRAGGSWATLCGPVGEAGPEVWVLHEDGETVTLIRPDGAASLPLVTFEAEILRAPPQTFLRFSSEGLLTHTFPPQWALADCGADGGARAVTLHDPWRDSVAGRPPEGSADPAWWWWPARPRRRPRTPRPDAPAAPLGLTLADVWYSRDPGSGGGDS